MIRKGIDKLIGKECKIIAREPGEEYPFVVFGTLTEIDHANGFLVIDSKEGVGCINIATVEAIRPKNKDD